MMGGYLLNHCLPPGSPFRVNLPGNYWLYDCNGWQRQKPSDWIFNGHEVRLTLGLQLATESSGFILSSGIIFKMKDCACNTL